MVTIRDAIKSDLQNLNKFNNDLLDHLQEIHWVEDLVIMPAVTNARFNKKQYSMICLNNLVIGYIRSGTSIKENTLNIYELFIELDYRRVGYGSKVIQQLIQSNSQKNNYINILVLKGNTNAIKFYKNHGFTQSNIKYDDDNIVEYTLRI